MVSLAMERRPALVHEDEGIVFRAPQTLRCQDLRIRNPPGKTYVSLVFWERPWTALTASTLSRWWAAYRAGKDLKGILELAFAKISGHPEPASADKQAILCARLALGFSRSPNGEAFAERMARKRMALVLYVPKHRAFLYATYGSEYEASQIHLCSKALLTALAVVAPCWPGVLTAPWP